MASSCNSPVGEVEAALETLFMSPSKRTSVSTPSTSPPTTPETEINTYLLGESTRRLSFYIQLDRALIKYITKTGSRVLYADQVDTWNDFHSSGAEYLEKFGECSAAELCEEFVEKVLPIVYSYELTDHEARILRLLELHPEFKRVPEGFVRVPATERVAHCRAIKQNIDYHVTNATEREQMFASTLEQESNEAISFVRPQQSDCHHTLVLTGSYQRQRAGYNYQFSRTHATLLSAALSSNLELSGYVLLEPKELHKRLKQAKYEFEKHAIMPENCTDIRLLMGKMQRLKQMRKAVINIMTDTYL